MKLFSILIPVLLSPLLASAQLVITVSSPKLTANKALVSLAMKNNFAEKIESARAEVFLLDDHGKVVGQSTKWVIGGGTSKPGLAAGATNAFYFVIKSAKPFTTTNLTSKMTFTRLILEGGKVVDVNQNVEIKP
jgi:hypothetical protein